MYIHLKWANANTQQVVTNIYRGTSTLDRNNLGTPLVTLSNGETEYYDRTVVGGTTYYYVLEYVSATNRVKSRVYSFLADYFRGHGNNVVIFGNDDYGFMGLATFTSYTELLAKIGIARESATPTLDGTLVGSKFSVNGKVYIAPVINATYIDITTLLAFLKRTDKMPVTIDSVNYLAYPLDMVGDTFVWNNNYVAQPPSGKRDLFEQLIVSQIPTVTMDGNWKADTIGRVNNYGAANWLCKATESMARCPYWSSASNVVNFTNTLSSTYLFTFVLELVEE